MITNCKKCNSNNLYLEPRILEDDVLKADMVALKCRDCGFWQKWCPKDERQFYLKKSNENIENEKNNNIYLFYFENIDGQTSNKFIFANDKVSAINLFYKTHLSFAYILAISELTQEEYQEIINYGKR